MRQRKFRIMLARTAGFCMGVRRALRMVLNAADEPSRPVPIKTIGPLIHNRQVLQVLEKRGVVAAGGDESEQIGTAVIRAHGLSEQEQDELRHRCREVLDATCPHVRRVQQILQQHAAEGYTCVVVGDAGHAEVKALLSFTDGAGHVISGPDQVGDLPEATKVVVVAQTTQDEELFRRTVRRMKGRYAQCLAFETTCDSTSRRQAEARSLARRVDAMVVVGGFHSANTRRLAEICAATGTPTYHVETERQLQADEVLRYETVGLTAGASTPNWLIRRVIRRLEDQHLRRSNFAAYVALMFVRGLINANVYAAGGAAALTFALARLLPHPVGAVELCMAISFFFVLAQQLLNQYVKRESLYLSEPDRADFFMANEGALLWLAVCSSAAALLLSYVLGWGPFLLVVLGSVGGSLYRVRLPRVLGARLGLRSMEQFAGFKEMFVGLAWATLTALVPALAVSAAPGLWKSAAVAFVAAFLMVFERTLLLDLRDIETDQIVGRETLAGLLGPRASGRLFGGAVLALALVIVGAGCLAGWTTPYCCPLLIGVPWALASYVVLKRGGRAGGRGGNVAEGLVDGQFYVMALAAAAWGWLAAGPAL